MLDKVRHWVSMPKYAKAHHLNLQLYGRRKEENTIPEPIYKTKKHGDIVQCHAIHDWTKEEVWKYIKDNDLIYPSCYKDGSQHLRSWVTMAHQAYAKRNSINDAFEIVYETASDYLIAAGTVDERVIRFLFR